MADSDKCGGCAHRHACSEVFEHVGRRGGPNVAVVSMVAFILPIAVFVAALGLAELSLSSRLGRVTATGVGIFAGLLIAGVCVCVARGIRAVRSDRTPDGGNLRPAPEHASR